MDIGTLAWRAARFLKGALGSPRGTVGKKKGVDMRYSRVQTSCAVLSCQFLFFFFSFFIRHGPRGEICCRRAEGANEAESRPALRSDMPSCDQVRVTRRKLHLKYSTRKEGGGDERGRANSAIISVLEMIALNTV